MEDNRTQDALDELADLFLTGISAGGHTTDTDEVRGEIHEVAEVSEAENIGVDAVSAEVVVREYGEKAETMSREEENQAVGVEVSEGEVAESGVPQPRYGAGRSGMVKLRPKPAMMKKKDEGSVIRVPGGAPKPRVDSGNDEEKTNEGNSTAERMSELIAGIAPVAGNEKVSVAGRIGGEEILEGAIEDALDVIEGVKEEVVEESGEVVLGLTEETVNDLNVDAAEVLEEDVAHKQAQFDELHEELQRADEQAGLLEGKIEMGGVNEIEEKDEVALDQDQYEQAGEQLVAEQVLEVVSGEEEDVVVAERLEDFDDVAVDANEIEELVGVLDMEVDGERVDEEDEKERGAYVESVYLGNLPGVSGPWLTQYAQLVAQEEGAVVVLHVDDGQVDAELVEPIVVGRRGIEAREPRRVMAKDAIGADLVEVLDELLTMPNPVRTILVHLDEGVDQDAFKRGAIIDDVTMCCGADDMAVMSVIQKLRNLADADRNRIAQKQVGLMIMGADEEHSRSAAAKISSQMTGELGCDVQLAGWQQQMIPVSVTQLGSYLGTTEQWENVREYLMGLSLPKAMEVEAETITVSDEQPYDGHFAEAGPIETAMMSEVNEVEQDEVVVAAEEEQLHEMEVSVVGDKRVLAEESEDGELTDAEAAALFAAEVRAELAEAGDEVKVEEMISAQVDKEVAEEIAADVDVAELVTSGLEDVKVEQRKGSLFSDMPSMQREPIVTAEPVEVVEVKEESATVVSEVPAPKFSEQPTVQEVEVSEPAVEEVDTKIEVLKEPEVVKLVQPVVPEPVVNAEEPAVEADEFTLAEIVTGMNGVLAGGTILEAYCPKQPEVEFVLDQEGGLHLLAMHDSKDSVQVASLDQQRQIDEANMQRTVMNLLEVKQWAEEHAEILAMTQRQLRFNDQPAKLHLFTDRADLGTKLITRFEGDLKLHLLQVIEVGNDATVFCTPLN
ncbi:hypothetical protein JD969_09375 [Planctomycetota bacterium]|nr:hypothetical protein JD969_09375 [Planctomycetota bacterium]